MNFPSKGQYKGFRIISQPRAPVLFYATVQNMKQMKASVIMLQGGRRIASLV